MTATTAAMLLLFSLVFGVAIALDVTWAGRSWWARDSGGEGATYPGPNYWQNTNIEVQPSGDLVLWIRSSTTGFSCAEVNLRGGALGYGTYTWDVTGPVETITADANAVLGLFLYYNDTTELDVEFARWGVASSSYNNSQYVNQPLGSGKIRRFMMPLGVQRSRHVIRWSPGKVEWESINLDTTLPTHVFGWSTTTKVPEGRLPMVPIVNLWMMNGIAPASLPLSATISNFTFVKYVAPAPPPKDSSTFSLSIVTMPTSLLLVVALAIEFFCN